MSSKKVILRSKNDFSITAAALGPCNYEHDHYNDPDENKSKPFFFLRV